MSHNNISHWLHFTLELMSLAQFFSNYDFDRFRKYKPLMTLLFTTCFAEQQTSIIFWHNVNAVLRQWETNGA